MTLVNDPIQMQILTADPVDVYDYTVTIKVSYMDHPEVFGTETFMTLSVVDRCPGTSYLSGFSIPNETYVLGANALLVTIPPPVDSSAGGCGPIDYQIIDAPIFVNNINTPSQLEILTTDPLDV